MAGARSELATAHLTLLADYFQIHVLDEESQTDLGDVWTEQAALDGLASAADALAIGTTENLDIAVDVDILPTEPDDEGTAFDHVIEASLYISSGRMVVMGCTDYLPSAPRFDVPVGWIRVRASRSDSWGAVQGEDAAPVGHLWLQVWPAPRADARIIARSIPPQA